MFNCFCYLLIVCGLIQRIQAVYLHGFSLVPLEPYELCTRGFYKYVRHPAYLGTLFIVFGLCALLDSILTAGLFSYLFYIVLADRARMEEKLIIEKFPFYSFYQSKTGFIFPKLF